MSTPAKTGSCKSLVRLNALVTPGQIKQFDPFELAVVLSLHIREPPRGAPAPVRAHSGSRQDHALDERPTHAHWSTRSVICESSA